MNNTSAEIEAVRQRYQASLMDKALTVSNCLTALESDQGCCHQAGVQQTQEFLHKLAGSSGMYGYQDISELARTAMRDIEQNDQNNLHKRLSQLRELLVSHSEHC
jgi:HPt (histidine-containing phosphotransfer) domain-containing protein